jgi:hypothetical protein
MSESVGAILLVGVSALGLLGVCIFTFWDALRDDRDDEGSS